MTVAEIAARLLHHFSPEEREIPDNENYPGRNAAVQGAMNGTLEEIFGETSPWVRSDKRGHILNAPATVPITLTNGDTAGVIEEEDWQEWFAGCTIIVSGSTFENRITNAERNVKLMLPHEGTTGSVQATVYQDSVTITADVLRVLSPVRIDRLEIHPTATTDAFTNVRSDQDYGFSRQYAGNRYAPMTANTIGRPLTYTVESWSPSDTAIPLSRIRIFPAPDKAYSLDYSAMLLPPVVTDIASTNTLPIPHNWIDSLFIPIAEKRLSASPFWAGVISMDSLTTNYRMAMELLRSSNPRKRRGITLKSPY